MAQKDWLEVKIIIENTAPSIFSDFIASDKVFLPNNLHVNPFEIENGNFSAKQLHKSKPGNWIPLYHQKELYSYFKNENITPIRAGQAEFFFYKGTVFFDLKNLQLTEIKSESYRPIESFIPHTLKVNFQRNENAYLNKAIALGIVNHFVDGENYEVLEKKIKTNHKTRLLYGQFGKIKITTPIIFKTSRTSKEIKNGFQFEIDLVVENEDEIIIFEAKSGEKSHDNFSLLQLYYPLVYFRKLIRDTKKIRTIFIDIISNNAQEEYRLVEFIFKNDCFDNARIKQKFSYKVFH